MEETYQFTNIEQHTSGSVQARLLPEPESRWFAGHFKDNPLLPGVAQLDMVARLYCQAFAKQAFVSRLSRVKFRKIISPGDELMLQLEPAKGEGRFTFQITAAGEDVCSGAVTFQHL